MLGKKTFHNSCRINFCLTKYTLGYYYFFFLSQVVLGTFASIETLVTWFGLLHMLCSLSRKRLVEPIPLQFCFEFSFPSHKLVTILKRVLSVLLFTYSWRENTFPSSINTMWNVNKSISYDNRYATSASKSVCMYVCIYIYIYIYIHFYQ